MTNGLRSSRPTQKKVEQAGISEEEFEEEEEEEPILPEDPDYQQGVWDDPTLNGMADVVVGELELEGEESRG